jgi:hypothetical protein
MLCQMCLQAEATVHVLDRLSGDHPVEADYCKACYDLKYVHLPARPRLVFPRPRFTIQDMIGVVVVAALLNMAIVLVMRSPLIPPGTPAQVRDWTIKAFLGMNLGFGLMMACIFSMSWLARIRLYKMTGGLVPTPEWKMPPLKVFLRRLVTGLGPMLAWWTIGMFLLRWLVSTRTLWAGGRPNHQVILLVLGVITLVPLIWTFHVIRSNRALVARIRAVWGRASRGELTFTILSFLWPLASIVTLYCIPGFYSILARNPWVIGLLMLSIGFGGSVMLAWGAVVSTRRR